MSVLIDENCKIQQAAKASELMSCLLLDRPGFSRQLDTTKSISEKKQGTG